MSAHFKDEHGTAPSRLALPDVQGAAISATEEAEV